jgi:SAM-dependent methyltransferase
MAISLKPAHSWFPGNYYFDPRIHTFGNHGVLGKLHAKVAPYFTKAIDATVYGKDVRKDAFDNFKDKKILDFGCGTGFSTAENKGSLGIDTSEEMIEEAVKQFPMKKFEYGHAEHYEPGEPFDVVTAMFIMHEVPQFARKKMITHACYIASETVVILDISPEYVPSSLMLEGEPYLLEYLKNIRKDLVDFKEEVVVPGHVHKWTINLDDECTVLPTPDEEPKDKKSQNKKSQDKNYNSYYTKSEYDYRGVQKINF